MFSVGRVLRGVRRSLPGVGISLLSIFGSSFSGIFELTIAFFVDGLLSAFEHGVGRDIRDIRDIDVPLFVRAVAAEIRILFLKSGNVV